MTAKIIPLHRCTEVEECPTTMRHPRTLADAFPDERAPAIEAPAPSGYSVTWWIAVLVVSSLGAIAIAFGRPA